MGITSIQMKSLFNDDRPDLPSGSQQILLETHNTIIWYEKYKYTDSQQILLDTHNTIWYKKYKYTRSDSQQILLDNRIDHSLRLT